MTDGGMTHSDFRLADNLLFGFSSGSDWTKNNHSLSHHVQKFRRLSRNLILVEAYSQY